MSVLYLVRHGQTSLFNEDYDQLSPIGIEQARGLGLHWSSIGVKFDRVFLGPRQCHRQTHDAARASFRATSDDPWPEPIVLPEFNDHQGDQVFRHVVPYMEERDVLLRKLGGAFLKGDLTMRRAWMESYVRISRRWMRNELDVDTSQFESWSAFRQRITRGLEGLVRMATPRERIAVFTSAGPMAATMGQSLDLDDTAILKLNWAVRNAAISEFFFSAQQLSLSAFNTTPHLLDQKLLTYI